jgi:hypothetical protein
MEVQIEFAKIVMIIIEHLYQCAKYRSKVKTTPIHSPHAPQETHLRSYAYH